LPQTVAQADLWYTVASDHIATDAFIDAAKAWIDGDGGAFDRSVLPSTLR
jgi:hypothetical protein